MSTVELRNDTSGLIPHTFIVVTGPDGIPHGWGFYPQTAVGKLIQVIRDGKVEIRQVGGNDDGCG